MNALSEKQQKDFRDILAWLRGGDTTPDPDMEEKFIDTLTGIVRQQMNPTVEVEVHTEAPKPRTRNIYGDRPHPLSLKALMREVTGDENYELPKIEVATEPVEIPMTKDSQEKDNDSEETIDSVVVARTLVNMAQCNAHGINMSQIQAILYIAYGSVLASKGKRLTDEHPQMWEYGPVFPKAYNKLRKHPSDGEAESKELKEKHPDIWNYLSDCFTRYAWTSATNLTAPHVAVGSPWSKTRKKNPDKWGAVIEDELIKEWFKDRI